MFLQQFTSPFWDVFFTIITYLGAQTLGIFIGIILFWCGNKEKGYKFLYAVVFSFSLNNIIKGIVKAPRPIGTPGINSSHISTATGYSFPSGHSQGNATTFTLLMGEIRKKWFWALGIIMMILVPISRLYFGVHWPKDIIVGTFLGIISVFISNRIFKLAYEKNDLYIFFSYVPFMLIGIVFPSDDLFKALGAFTAIAVGFIIERRYIKYVSPNATKQKIINTLIGLLGALLIYLCFSLLSNSIFISFIKYFSLTFWAIVICPLIFTKLNKKTI